MIRPSITVERHRSDPDGYVISDGEQSVELGRSADMPLVNALLTQVLRESFEVEEFTRQNDRLMKITLVTGEPDYEFCLRLLSGECDERFCVARRRDDGHADYLCSSETADLVWVSDPLFDGIALFVSQEDARLVVNSELDRNMEIQKRFMLKG